MRSGSTWQPPSTNRSTGKRETNATDKRHESGLTSLGDASWTNAASKNKSSLTSLTDLPGGKKTVSDSMFDSTATMRMQDEDIEAMLRGSSDNQQQSEKRKKRKKKTKKKKKRTKSKKSGEHEKKENTTVADVSSDDISPTDRSDSTLIIGHRLSSLQNDKSDDDDSNDENTYNRKETSVFETSEPRSEKNSATSNEVRKETSDRNDENDIASEYFASREVLKMKARAAVARRAAAEETRKRQSEINKVNSETTEKIATLASTSPIKTNDEDTADESYGSDSFEIELPDNTGLPSPAKVGPTRTPVGKSSHVSTDVLDDADTLHDSDISAKENKKVLSEPKLFSAKQDVSIEDSEKLGADDVQEDSDDLSSGYFAAVKSRSREPVRRHAKRAPHRGRSTRRDRETGEDSVRDTRRGGAFDEPRHTETEKHATDTDTDASIDFGLFGDASEKSSNDSGVALPDNRTKMPPRKVEQIHKAGRSDRQATTAKNDRDGGKRMGIVNTSNSRREAPEASPNESDSSSQARSSMIANSSSVDSNMKSRLARELAEREKLERTLQDMQSQLTRTTAKFEDAKEEARALHESKREVDNDAERRIQMLQQSLDESRTECARAKKKLEAAEAENADLRSKLSSLAEEKLSVTKGVDSRILMLKESHRADIERREAAFEEKISMMKRQHLIALEHRKEKSKEIEDMVSKLRSGIASLDDLRKKVDAQHSASTSTREGSIEAREALLRDMEVSSAQMRSAVGEKSRVLQQMLSSMHESTQASSRKLEDDRARLRQEHARLEALEAALKAERDVARAENAKERQRLIDERSAVRSQIRDAENEYRELRQQIQSLEAKAATERARIEKETKEVSEQLDIREQTLRDREKIIHDAAVELGDRERLVMQQSAAIEESRRSNDLERARIESESKTLIELGLRVQDQSARLAQERDDFSGEKERVTDMRKECAREREMIERDKRRIEDRLRTLALQRKQQDDLQVVLARRRKEITEYMTRIRRDGASVRSSGAARRRRRRVDSSQTSWSAPRVSSIVQMALNACNVPGAKTSTKTDSKAADRETDASFSVPVPSRVYEVDRSVVTD
eukprot:g80.t1